MSDGQIKFYAQPTPSYDDFESVTVSAGCLQVGGFGGFTLHKEMGTDEARTFAAQIIAACEVVERDSAALGEKHEEALATNQEQQR